MHSYSHLHSESPPGWPPRAAPYSDFSNPTKGKAWQQSSISPGTERSCSCARAPLADRCHLSFRQKPRVRLVILVHQFQMCASPSIIEDGISLDSDSLGIQSNSILLDSDFRFVTWCQYTLLNMGLLILCQEITCHASHGCCRGVKHCSHPQLKGSTSPTTICWIQLRRRISTLKNFPDSQTQETAQTKAVI